MDIPLHTWLFDNSAIPKLHCITTFESMHNVTTLTRVFQRAFIVATNSTFNIGFNKVQEVSDIVETVFGDYIVEDFFFGEAFPFDDACHELTLAFYDAPDIDPFYIGRALDKLSRLFDFMSDDLDRKYSKDE